MVLECYENNVVDIDRNIWANQLDSTERWERYNHKHLEVYSNLTTQRDNSSNYTRLLEQWSMCVSHRKTMNFLRCVLIKTTFHRHRPYRQHHREVRKTFPSRGVVFVVYQHQWPSCGSLNPPTGKDSEATTSIWGRWRYFTTTTGSKHLLALYRPEGNRMTRFLLSVIH